MDKDVIVVGGFFIIAVIITVMMVASIVEVKVYTNEEYEIIREVRAACKSANGTMSSNDNCYKNGVLFITRDGKMPRDEVDNE